MSLVPSQIIASAVHAATLEEVRAHLSKLAQILNGELDFGYPDDGTGAQQVLNIRGGWASASITAAAQLGAGGSAPVTFTHNLDLPVVLNANSDPRPNVRPFSLFVSHGDATGTNAPPAATANPAHTSVHFRFGDSVTANAIELRVHSSLAPSATQPINIDIFFHPAVQ